MIEGNEPPEWRTITDREDASTFVDSCTEPEYIEITHVPDCEVLELLRENGFSYERYRREPKKWYVEPPTGEGTTDGEASTEELAGTFVSLTLTRQLFVIAVCALLLWAYFERAIVSYAPLVGVFGVAVTVFTQLKERTDWL